MLPGLTPHDACSRAQSTVRTGILLCVLAAISVTFAAAAPLEVQQLLDISQLSLRIDVSLQQSSNSATVPLLKHLRQHVHRHTELASWGSADLNASAVLKILEVQVGDLEPSCKDLSTAKGSFVVSVNNTSSDQHDGITTIVLCAHDASGFRSGVGRLARELRLRQGQVQLPRRRIVEDGGAALWSLRGHQYTAAHFPSMFRTWTEFDTFTHDNAVFGTNQIELAHFGHKNKSIDASQLVEYASRLDKAGMNVSFWWSLDLFTANRTAVQHAWCAMPRLDSVFFPGGDGGALVWPDIATAASVVHECHPQAAVWVSAQEFSEAQLEAFYATIDTPLVRAFLHGVVIGPHWSIPTAEAVQRMPKGYSVRQYPDICHPRGAQYAVPDWHWAWQMTHGRQAVNPMPRQHAAIVRLRANGSTPTAGAGAYSEGLNDDLNKAVWSGLAESPGTSVRELVAQYARYHFGADHEEAMAAALFGLEQNWVGGDIGANTAVLSTLRALQGVERATPRAELADPANWRLPMYLYRGYYDAYVQARYRFERQAEERAMEALATAPAVGSAAAMAAATAQLERGTNVSAMDSAARRWRARVLELKAVLNSSVGASVVQGQATDLNIGGVDRPLNDRGFLLASFAATRRLPTEAARLAALGQLVGWTDPGPGGFYDDLGDPEHAPHLDRGPGAAVDPDFYQSPYTTAIPAKPAPAGSGAGAGAGGSGTRLSWQRYALTFYDNSMSLVYGGLDPNARYELALAFYGKPPPPPPSGAGGERASAGAAGSSMLTANGIILQGYQPPPPTMQVRSFRIPHNATTGGALRVQCQQPKGVGGTGRACKISEAWLRQVQ